MQKMTIHAIEFDSDTVTLKDLSSCLPGDTSYSGSVTISLADIKQVIYDRELGRGGIVIGNESRKEEYAISLNDAYTLMFFIAPRTWVNLP